MEKHLSDEQVTLALAGQSAAETRAHLEGCAECREEYARLALALGGMRRLASAGAERPAGFWKIQRQAILARVEAPGTVQPQLALWAGAMAVLALAATLLAQTPVPGASRKAAAVDPDHLLLVEVEQTVRRTVPQALEPATLLAQEMAQAFQEQAREREGGAEVRAKAVEGPQSKVASRNKL